MAILNSAQAQLKLKLAEETLWIQLEAQNLDDNPRLWLTFSLLRAVRIYSESGNSIPGLGGLGLEEALTLAQSVIDGNPRSDKDLSIQSYGALAQSITVISKAPVSP